MGFLLGIGGSLWLREDVGGTMRYSFRFLAGRHCERGTSIIASEYSRLG